MLEALKEQVLQANLLLPRYGVVTLQDAAQILRYLTGGWGAVIDLESADANGDGKADLKDVVLLRRYLAGGWDMVLDHLL